MLLINLYRRLRGAIAFAFFAAALPLSPVHAATFQGEFWATPGPSANINQAIAAISGATPTATFISTAIDYPNGNRNTQRSNQTLTQFLGADAASIVGDGTEQITTSVFRFTGFLDLVPGQQNFSLASDDGYRLTIDGNIISERSAPRSFRSTALDANAGSGTVPFELIFYENFGNTGVEFFIDSALAAPAAVPVPATLSLGLTGIAAFAMLGWRRRQSRNLPLALPA